MFGSNPVDNNDPGGTVVVVVGVGVVVVVVLVELEVLDDVKQGAGRFGDCDQHGGVESPVRVPSKAPRAISTAAKTKSQT
jgi:hypothetical protein